MSGEMLHERKGWTTELTWYHWLVLAVACFGWAFDTMDQWLYVFVKQHALRELLGPDVSGDDLNWYIGFVQSSLIFGWATGGLIFGMIGDLLGRTRTMALTILIYAGFTGLSGLAQTWEQFAVLRFLTGLGVGGEFAAGAALVSETFPEHARATAMGVVQATSALGNVTAALLNLGVATFLDPATAWRWMFAIGVVPALLVFVIFLFIKEPQRWRDSRSALRKAKRSNMSVMLELFTNPAVRRNTLVGVGIGTVGVIGFWGISTWTPELLRNILNPDGLAELKTSVEQKVSYAGMAQNIGSFLGALCFPFFAQRIGRKRTFYLALLGCLIEIPATFFFTHSFETALIFFFGMGFMLLFLLGGFAVYFPELFPTRLRATGTGLCYNVARYLAALFPTFFGALSKQYGIQNAALMLSSMFVVGMIIVWFGPETKGKPLPE